MAKRNWKEVIDRAISAFRSGEYVYLYGAKNVRLTSEAQKHKKGVTWLTDNLHNSR